jgi:hypothetical protein
MIFLYERRIIISTNFGNSSRILLIMYGYSDNNNKNYVIMQCNNNKLILMKTEINLLDNDTLI